MRRVTAVSTVGSVEVELPAPVAKPARAPISPGAWCPVQKPIALAREQGESLRARAVLVYRYARGARSMEIPAGTSQTPRRRGVAGPAGSCRPWVADRAGK